MRERCIALIQQNLPMDHVDSSVPGGSQSGLSVTTGSQDPHGPMGTLIYVWDAPGAELAT
eukprot:scaffold74052_cov81-Phaeocystis_antarctica.AAC.1